MLYINLGFPKTSTTNLQKNVFPRLKGIKYIGRLYDEEQLDIFIKLNDLVENRIIFNEKKYNSLIKDFQKLCNNANILISNENWTVPYQRNNLTNKFEIVSQFEKLNKLSIFLEKADIEYKYFIFERDIKESIKSVFYTLSERIEMIFGKKYLNFECFLKNIINKGESWEQMLLLINIFNKELILDAIGDHEIMIFEYNCIKNNPKLFIQDLSKYLNIKTNYDLVAFVKVFTRVSLKKNKSYMIEKKKFLFDFFQRLLPKSLIDIFRPFINLGFIRKIIFKKYILDSSSDELLEIIIDKNYKIKC